MLPIFYALLTVEFADQFYLFHSLSQRRLCGPLLLLYYIVTERIMLGRNRHNKSVWRRKKSEYSTPAPLPDDPSFEQLKSVSKRLSIISRLERKQMQKQENRKINKTVSKIDLDCSTQNNREYASQRRPATTKQARRMNNITAVKEIFKEEKKINQYLMSEKGEAEAKKNFSQGNTTVKEGLLGEYTRYNEMSKHELIEKLISLEYLANNIFRKNKALEEKIKLLDPNFKLT